MVGSRCCRKTDLRLKRQGFLCRMEWWEIISNAAMHNAYHIGQIVFIRKFIGSRE